MALKTLGLAAAAALAFVGCEQRQSGSNEPGAVAQNAQQKAEQAYERATKAQEQASTEQQQAQQAREEVESTRQELAQAEQKAQQEAQQSAQAQQQAQQEGQAAQQQAQQSQQEAAAAQQQAQQQAQQEQQQHATQQQQQARDQQQAQTGGSAGAGQSSLDGEVLAVEKERLTLVVPQQGRFDVFLNEQSQVLLDGQPATPDQLAQGQQIRASYQLEGSRRVATRVEAQSATGGAGQPQ